MRKALLGLFVMGFFGACAATAAAQVTYSDDPQTRARQMQEARDNQDREDSKRRADQLARDAAWWQERLELTRNEMAAIRSMPVLPTAKNPILGKWVAEISQKAKPKEDDLLGQLTRMSESGLCELMFSDGVVEFKAGDWWQDDVSGNDSLGPVSYRGQGSIVAVVPAKGINAMAFQIVSPDRIIELRSSQAAPCTLIRVPQTTTYATRPRAGRSAATAGRPAASPGGAPAAATGAAAAPRAAQPGSAKGAALRASIDPRSPLGQGVALHNSGYEFQEALRKLLEVEKATPNDPRVHAYLSNTYFRLSMPAEARAEEAKARALDPEIMEILK